MGDLLWNEIGGASGISDIMGGNRISDYHSHDHIWVCSLPVWL